MSTAPLTSQVVTFPSADGVPISCWRSGAGPALVAVHGTGADHTAWDRVTPLLSDHFTVYAMDRRGRGASGDSSEYSLEREFADVTAVVEGIGQPVHLYGHSFGVACTLAAATRARNVASLIIYEGGVKPPGVNMTLFSDELITRLEALIVDGQQEEALALFLQTGVGLTPPEMDIYRRSPSWPARVAAMRTVPRELRAVNEYESGYDRFRSLDMPALFLVGGKTSAMLRVMFLALSAVLPHSQIRELAGQGHTAHETAPELVANALTEFLADVAR